MAELKGLSNVLKNLNKEIANIQLNTVEGLTEACLVVKYDSVKGTPVDLSNLRGSAFIMVTGNDSDNNAPKFRQKKTAGGVLKDDTAKLINGHSSAMFQAKGIVGSDKWRLVGIVGYTAFYALFVHEMPSHYNFNQGGNKFLQKALLKNKDRILRILVKWAKIKK